MWLKQPFFNLHPREIFRVLDLMKLDMVNFTLENLRPELQKQAVEYERAKFQSIVDKMPGESTHISYMLLHATIKSRYIWISICN